MSAVTRICLVVILCLGLSRIAPGQLPQTVLFAVAPAGGQVGTEFDVRITAGSDLDDLKQLAFSHPGITARPKMVERDGEMTASEDQFTVRIPADVPPGTYEVRCGGLWGYSNPRRFLVGSRPELKESGENNTPQRATWIDLNTVANGCLDAANDVDWFRFFGKKGQRIVIDCWGERIDSRLHGVISVYDNTGRRRLATSRNVKGDDPVILFDVPADREYLIQLHDLTYRGGPEYGYRLAVNTDPYIELIDPPAATAGVTGTFTLWGYNLPGGQLTGQQLRGQTLEKLDVQIAVPDEVDRLSTDQRTSPLAAGQDAFTYRLQTAAGQTSNPVRIGISPGPVQKEAEPNGLSGQAQRLMLPMEICGTFGTPRDLDLFRFEAQAGELLAIDVCSERCGSLADPVLTLQQVKTNADGVETFKQIAAQDDVVSNLSMNLFETRTDDPTVRVEIPESGLYEIRLRDRYGESRGDPSLFYRLAVRPLTPDFRLVAVPTPPMPGQVWPAGLRRGDNLQYTVYVFRRDGFEGPVRITASQLPPGLACPSVVIGAKENSGQVVLTATDEIQPGLYRVELLGTADVNDPRAQQAELTLKKELAGVENSLNELRNATGRNATALADSTLQAQSAREAAQAKPDDESLRKRSEFRQQELAKLQEAQRRRDAELAQLEQKKSGLIEHLRTAQEQRVATVRQVTRGVRAATVIWSFHDVQPAICRITDGVYVSVMQDAAPFQLLADVHQLEACQGSELQIPVSLYRRGEFQGKVTVQAQAGENPAGLDVTPMPFGEGLQAEQLRLFIGDQLAPGVYTLDLRGQSEVTLRRNPARAERMKERHERFRQQAENARKIVDAAGKKKADAAAALNGAYQKQHLAQSVLSQKQQELDALRPILAAAEQTFKQTSEDLSQRTAEWTQGEQSAKAAAARLKAHDDLIAQTEKQLAAAEAALQRLREQTLPEGVQPAGGESESGQGGAPAVVPLNQGDLDAAVKAVEELRKSRSDLLLARDALKTAQELATETHSAEAARKEAAHQLNETAKARLKAQQLMFTQSESALQSAQLELRKAQTELSAAENAFSQSEMVEKAAEESFTAIDRTRQNAEREMNEAIREAEPRQVHFNPPVTPVVLTVKPAPVHLTAKLPPDAVLSSETPLSIEVQVTRQNGFEGPVSLALQGRSVNGIIEAAPQQLEPGESHAVLNIVAVEKAESQTVQFTIRATVDQDGVQTVDVPVSLTVKSGAP
ncbi:hypothetical protein [Planctomicrobium sp. SH664]|uniref:hypothetical protein n=1 Tax=Planctomicrobium sp. SH664 TaxID=3448125 RepID=UPI003F5CA222